MTVFMTETAPKRPFNPMRFHGNWRWFFDYGTGDLGNDGVHRLDYARWALSAAGEAQGEKPLYMPTKISAIGGKWYFDDIQEWPDTLQVNFEYPGQEGKPGKILTYEMRVWTPYGYNDESEGAILYGDQGYLIIGNRRWRAFNPEGEIVAQGSGDNDGTTHTVNSADADNNVDANGPLSSGSLEPGDTYSHTFEATGVYLYRCQQIASMKGSVTVQ